MSFNSRINKAKRQLNQDRRSRSIPLPIFDWREVDGTNFAVGNTAAGGGLLSSNTTPIGESGTTTAINQFMSWATTVVDPVAIQVPLPADFDGSQDVTVDLWVASGTTDAASFALLSSWDAGATVTDAFDDAASKSATIHKITATIAAADIADTARFCTLVIVPPAHATNAIAVHNAQLNYSPIGV